MLSTVFSFLVSTAAKRWSSEYFDIPSSEIVMKSYGSQCHAQHYSDSFAHLHFMLSMFTSNNALCVAKLEDW